MTKEIIWLHDKALNRKHEVLKGLSDNSRMIFVWDDDYFRNRSYSLKRLVFIYETLCQMSIEIIEGNTLDVMNSLEPGNIKTFFTTDTKIKEIINKLSEMFQIEVIEPNPFVQISESYDFKRFFTYWDQAKKTAFLKNGGQSA